MRSSALVTPAALVRRRLAAERANGADFDHAWTVATHDAPMLWQDALDSCRPAFKAAYLRELVAVFPLESAHAALLERHEQRWPPVGR
jgi:hypothetical protein